MRRSVCLLSFLLAACAGTTSVPDEQEDAAVDVDAMLIKSLDARPRHDGSLSVVPRPDAGLPEVTIDAAPPPAQGKRIFVTSTVFTGNLGGLTGADTACQARAAAAHLGGSWKAWLSSSTTPAIERITDAGPYYRLDGTKVFEQRADMGDYPLAPINVSEQLAQLPEDGVWTGTSAGGAIYGSAAEASCDDWTSASGDLTAIIGILSESSSLWTDYGGGGACSDTWRLYCVEQ